MEPVLKDHQGLRQSGLLTQVVYIYVHTEVLKCDEFVYQIVEQRNS